VKNDYFNTPARMDALHRVLVEWEGTPFVPFASIKGAGVDCVRFGAAVMAELGVITPVTDWPVYTMRGGGEAMLRVLFAHIEALDCMRRMPGLDNVRAGDALVFSTGRALHHVAVAYDEAVFFHAMPGYGVERASLADDTFGSRLVRVYRPQEERP
jgi:cell wall-associated NlpC family hydrolase